MEGYYTGRVSGIDSEHGFVKVTYPQENNTVSDWLPLLAFEYNLPKVGELVGTILDKNLNGVCLGKIFSYEQTPKSSDGYRKDIDDDFEVHFGNGYVKYKNGILYVKADKIELDGYKITEG